MQGNFMKNIRATAGIYFGAIFMLASVLPVTAGLPAADSESEAGLRINQTEPAEFPVGALHQGIHSGKVRVVVSVDAEGKLVDYLVVAYTNEIFVSSAVRALKSWTYEPAKVHGHVRASRADIAFVYKGDMVVAVQNADYNITQGMFGQIYKFEPSVLRDLDHIPVPLHVVTPLIPDGVLAAGEVRVVTVEFYIDQEGKVRVPSVSREQVDDQLAAAAVDAVEQWSFEPPMRKGQPVLVLAQQDFHFVAKTNK